MYVMIPQKGAATWGPREDWHGFLLRSDRSFYRKTRAHSHIQNT